MVTSRSPGWGDGSASIQTAGRAINSPRIRIGAPDTSFIATISGEMRSAGEASADLPVLHHQYAVGPPDQRRPMRHDDARDRHLRNEIGDRLFRGLIEIGGALVEHENARPGIERPRQQHALALAAGERRSHRP